MYTFLHVVTVLSFIQGITKSQGFGLDALTPCMLTASDGAAVHAFCEEVITPCTLRASNGDIVQAYCESSLFSQPFASVTGSSVLPNVTGTASTFQILGSNMNTVRRAVSIIEYALF